MLPLTPTCRGPRWQPVWEWNGCTGGSAESIPYCNASFARVRAKQPGLNASAVAAVAGQEWEAAAKAFIGQTLAVAKKTRPRATWGFYDYPSCGDTAGEYNGADVMCPTGMQAGNNKLTWLFEASDALFPGPYLISTNDTWNRGFLRQPVRAPTGCTLCALSCPRSDLGGVCRAGH